MSNFDVALGMNTATLNGMISSLYGMQSLRNSLFAGSQSENIAGVQSTIAWNVLQVPTITLEAPTSQQWSSALGAGGTTPSPVANAITVSFPNVQVSMTPSGGQMQQATIPMVVICSVSIANAQLTLTPVGVIVDLSNASAFDQVVYKAVLIPQALQVAGSMLSGEKIPNISFNGVNFGEMVLSVGNGQIVGVAYLSSNSATPPAPDVSSMPNEPFYVLLSPAAMQQVVNSGTAGLQGKSASTSGSQSFGIGSADYNASVQLANVSASVNPGNLASVTASVSVQASASAGVNIFSSIINQIGSGLESAGQAIANAFSSY